MANKTSQHILGTSSNLLGFCLLVITSLHVSGRERGTHIDELTSVVALLLAFSAILSFISLRTARSPEQTKYELIAELLFFLSLIGSAVVIIIIALTYWSRQPKPQTAHQMKRSSITSDSYCQFIDKTTHTSVQYRFFAFERTSY